jgi:hypothetical protein
MPASGKPSPSEVLHTAADVILAAVAGGLVLVIFFPLTLCARGLRSAVRIVRPHPAETNRQHSITQH